MLNLMGLKLWEIAENGKIKGNLGGISVNNSLTTAQKVWRMFQGLGDIAFAFPFTSLVLEIQVYLSFFFSFLYLNPLNSQKLHA